MPGTASVDTSPNTLLARLFEHHAWSNRTLIDFLANLSVEQLRLTVPGTYGNVIDTVRHLISSNADYVRIIPDTPEVPQYEQDGPFGGWDELRAVAAASDSALVAYVGGLTEDKFFVDVDDGVEFALGRSILLAQIIHHATEHRSQIRTTLSTHGVTPPEISVWAWRGSAEGQTILAGLADDTRKR